MCNLQTIKNGAVRHYCAKHELFTDNLICPLSGYKEASALELLAKGDRKLVVTDGKIVRVITDETREETRRGHRSFETTTYTKVYVPVGELKVSEISEAVWWEVAESAKLTDWGEA